MKRFITVLSSLLVLPAFAEVAPVYYDDFVEYADDAINDPEVVAEDEQQAPVAQKNVAQRTTINRSTSATRAVAAGNSGASTRSNTSSRAMASSPRSTATRGTTSRTTKTSNVVNRAATRTSRTNVTARSAQNSKPVTARVSLRDSALPAYKASSSNSQATLDSQDKLYNPSRIGVLNRRSSARASTALTTTATTTPTITQEDISSTTNNLTALAELTDYCKAQYAACMDNYCNVLDDNQGRCSCSKNIKNYEKTEEALARATEEFQDVVQKIKYIGLTGDQIESLFTETEAELSMKSNSDSSRLKNSLDAIKKKIVDVSSPSASSYASNSGISLDLNGLLSADFTAGFDLNSFLGTTGTNTNSVSNQRGDQLYKTATNRCKTAVLNSCVAQGIDANVITNSYDLEIDKQCIAYERSLNEANTEMKNNVTNAANILQQARLLLAQNRNSYDLRSCVAAIDSCMQDEYICGSDYELCLDPTGKYLANGEIVKGGTPGVSGGQSKAEDALCANCTTDADCGTGGTCGEDGMCTDNCVAIDEWTSGGMYNLYSTWDYKKDSGIYNAWSFGTLENLGGYIDYHLGEWSKVYTKSGETTQTGNMAMYLLQKIGYIDSNDKAHGMCASVMKQCQDYTFSTKKTNKKYIPDNEVVRQYLNNTLAKIKVKQDEILADYAEGCRADVQSCLSTNGYEETNTKSTASKTAVNACAAEITTCMSVGGYQITDGVKLTLRAMSDWVASILLTCDAGYYLKDDGVGSVKCELCPAALKYTYTGSTACSNDPDCTVEPSQEPVYVATTSVGGRATSCTCTEGDDYYIKNPNADNYGELVCVVAAGSD